MRSGYCFFFAAALATASLSATAVAQTSDADICSKQSGETAIAACTRAIDSKQYSGENLAKLFLWRCIELNESQKFDDAINDCTAALKIAPKLDAALFQRGNAYSSKQQSDLAIADYSAAISLNPKNHQAFYNRGLAYARDKKPDSAIADFDQAIKLVPEFFAAYINRGSVYSDKGDNDHALADYDAAAKINPKITITYANRARIFRKRKQYERAIVEYSEALKYEPKAVLYLGFRCFVRAQAEIQLDEALSDCNEASRLQGRISPINAIRGFVHLKRGDLDRAQADADAVLTMAPKQIYGLYLRGLVKLKRGDTAGGEADLASAKQIRADVVAEFEK